MIKEHFPGIDELTREEKVILSQELLLETDGAELHDEFKEFPVWPWQVEVLEERLREADENPGAGIPREEAFARIRAELGLKEEPPAKS